MTIPKVIHYFYDDVPVWEKNSKSQVRMCINSWLRYCSDYHLMLWHDKMPEVQEIINKSAFAKRAYDLKLWAFVSDYVRYYVLYKYGGIYLDTDVELVGNFDKFLENKFFVSIEGDILWGENVPEPAIMGAEPQHKLIKACMDIYESEDIFNIDNFIANTIMKKALKNLYGFEKIDYANETLREKAKKFYDKNIKTQQVTNEKLYKNQIIWQDSNKEITIYPNEYFCPTWDIFKDKAFTSNTVAIHWNQSSWWDYKKIKVLKNPKIKIQPRHINGELNTVSALNYLLKQIFSINNSKDKKHKIITIFGIKVKLKGFPKSLFVDLFRKKYPNYISLGIIVKNEAQDIKEWIEYHRLIGVEKFYIYDDNSNDNIKEVLKPYVDKGIVDYQCCPANVVNRQVEAYNDIINRCKYQTKWIGFIDVDEFILPIEKDNLKDFLTKYEKYSGLGINWMCFDSNGHKKRPEGLIIENYTRIHKERELFAEEHHIKSIVNPRLVSKAEVHNCEFYRGCHVDEDMKPIKRQQFPKEHFLASWNSCHPHLRVNCDARKIIINHYWSKSEEEYKDRINKGFATHDEKRYYDEKRLNFSEYTFNNCIVDKYLSDLKINMNKEV